MPRVTMVDKALAAANEARVAILDAKVREEFGIAVKTEWSMFTGLTGAYVTTRVDGKKMTPQMNSYVIGLWVGWGLLDSTLVRQQERAGRKLGG